jgi:hypothetical protein
MPEALPESTRMNAPAVSLPESAEAVAEAVAAAAAAPAVVSISTADAKEKKLMAFIRQQKVTIKRLEQRMAKEQQQQQQKQQQQVCGDNDCSRVKVTQKQKKKRVHQLLTVVVCGLFGRCFGLFVMPSCL